MSTITRRIIPAIAIAGTMMLVATGCVMRRERQGRCA